jgi:hypothetical protein
MRMRVFELVKQDVIAGLSDYFEVKGYEEVTPTTADDGPLMNNGSGAVAWRCTCIDNIPFPDLQPTFTEVVVEGITIVTAGTKPTFSRFVDWNRVIGQLGEVHHRRSTDHPYVVTEREARKRALG